MAGDPLKKAQFVSVRQIGIGGLITKGDPQDLKDTESPDMRNIILDGGIIGPRNGTSQFIAAPNGETGVPSQLLKAKDSRGKTYLIAVYGTNFYLLDQSTPQWVLLNSSWSPKQTGLFYGSANWNLGSGKDAFYFCNGVDYVFKWTPLLDYLAASAASADTHITVKDATKFGTSGTLIIGGTAVNYNSNATGGLLNLDINPSNGATLTLIINGTSIGITFVTGAPTNPGDVKIDSTAGLPQTGLNLYGLLSNPSVSNGTQEALSAPNQALLALFTLSQVTDTGTQFVGNAGVTSISESDSADNLTFTPTNPLNILGLSAAVGANIPSGTAISVPITPITSIPIGKVLIVATAQSGFRLFVGNVVGSESTLYYSKPYNPTTGGSPQEDFGVVVGTLTGGFTPILSGEGGILDLIDFGQYLGIVKNNSLTQGYFLIDTTNDTIAFLTNPIEYGESIFPVGQHVDTVIENALYVPTLTEGIYQITPSSTGAQLSTTVTPFSDDIIQLLQGALSLANGRAEFFNRALYYTLSSIPNVNNLVLIRDFLWNAWLVWDDLNAADVKEANGTLFFLCADDGALYYLDPTSYQDARKGTSVGYTTYIFTKRFDFGKPADPKQQSLAMLQGYISQNTKIFVDCLYNENGSLATTTYVIDGDNSDYVVQVPVYGIGRISIGLNPIGGSQIGTIGFFRVFLDLLLRAGCHVVQFKVYTQNIGDNWGVTGLSVNPQPVDKTPTELIIGVE